MNKPQTIDEILHKIIITDELVEYSEYGVFWPEAKQAIERLIKIAEVKARIDELEIIDKANVGNGIGFLTRKGQDVSSQWENMEEYARRRIAELSELGATNE